MCLLCMHAFLFLSLPLPLSLSLCLSRPPPSLPLQLPVFTVALTVFVIPTALLFLRLPPPCRMYRSGEVPDIRAVTPSSVWAPLAMAAGHKPGIASRLLAAVLGSMVAAAADDGSQGRAAGDARTRRALKVLHSGFTLCLARSTHWQLLSVCLVLTKKPT